MKLTDLNDYVAQRELEGLTKIEVTLEYDPESPSGDYYVTKTKETFVYGDEEDADMKIDAARQAAGFAGCDKKFKAGKISKKTGEELTPDSYTVVVKLIH